MSDDPVAFYGNEGQHYLSSGAESIYEIGLIGTTKPLLIDLTYRSDILWSLPTDE